MFSSGRCASVVCVVARRLSTRSISVRLPRLIASVINESSAIGRPLASNRCMPSVSRRLYSDEAAAVSFHVQDADDFQQRVIDADKPVIVDFHADWCGPCRLLGPRLESMVNNRNGRVYLAKVNIDDCAELAMDFDVKAVPTVIAFKNGKQVKDEVTGNVEDEEINAFIDRLLIE